MKKFTLFLIMAVGFLVVPLFVLAANDVTTETGAQITLDSRPGLNYTVGTNTTVQSFKINASNIDFVVEASSVIDLTSADRSLFKHNSGDCTVVTTCTSSASSITITCSASVTEHTITITPSAAATCDNVADFGGGSGGSTSGGAAAPVSSVTQQTVEETFFVETPMSVVVGDSTHVVNVLSASDTEVSLIVRSDDFAATIQKNTIKELDTDEDGTVDLQLKYLGLDSDGKAIIKFTELAVANITCAITPKYAYKHSDAPAVYYITDRCTKRAFTKSTIFFTYFDSWDDVTLTSEAMLGSIEDDILGFMPWGPQYDPKYGALVKTVFDPKTYLLLGTERYWINSETVFTSLSYAWNWIEDIADDLLDKYTTGSEINYTDRHPNYTIIKYADSTKVYRLEPDPNDSAKQVKRHISDEDAFDALKFRWDRIVTVGDTEVYTDGDLLE